MSGTKPFCKVCDVPETEKDWDEKEQTNKNIYPHCFGRVECIEKRLYNPEDC